MAPPSNRRPGFSRRAQYGLFIGYLMALAGILLAVLLLIVAIVDPRGFAALRGAALDVTAPVSAGGRSVVGFFTDGGDAIGNYFRAASENAELRRKLGEARRGLMKAQAMEYENKRLNALLKVAGETEDEVTVARVVGSSIGSARRFAILSAGSSAGVEVGQPVRAPEGLIGRVLETGRWAARILLVTDGASNVPVRLVRDGTPALAVGRGDGTIELRTLEVGTNPFRAGDILVTSGIGGIFPPNIPVARVLAVQGDSAVARPIAQPDRADYAIVQRIYQSAVAGPLDQAPAMQTEPSTVAAPPPPPPGQQPVTPSPRQQSPQYQPALQRPQPAAAPAGDPRRPQPQ